MGGGVGNWLWGHMKYYLLWAFPTPPRPVLVSQLIGNRHKLFSLCSTLFLIHVFKVQKTDRGWPKAKLIVILQRSVISESFFRSSLFISRVHKVEGFGVHRNTALNPSPFAPCLFNNSVNCVDVYICMYIYSCHMYITLFFSC